MNKSKKLYFFLNPFAGKGTAYNIFEKLKKVLDKHNIEVEIYTSQSEGDIESLKEEVRKIHPMRRYGTPADIASLVSWLSGDEAGYASGQLWVLDGGLSAQVQQMRL